MACVISDVPRDQLDRAMTLERVAGIWKYAKANYIDKGVNFENTLSGVANDLSIPRDWVARAFTKPKQLRAITNEVYRLQDARREAIRSAKSHVATIDAPAGARLISALTSIPRRVLTFGHGPVFPVTHALDLAFSESKIYFQSMANAWKFASKAEHAAAVDYLLHHDLYALGRRAGLVIDPEQGPQGILIGSRQTSSWSRRAWDAIKVARISVFEKRWSEVPENERNIDTAKVIASQINHATGVMSPGEFGFGGLSKGMFAPQLTASKLAKTVFDPIKTVATYSKILAGRGAEVPFAERYGAQLRVKKAAQWLGAYASLLALNQGFLSAFGSNQKINYSDPKKADWLRFKAGGYVLNTRGSMEVIRLLGSIIAMSQANKKELYGATKTEAIRNQLARYAEYKADPALGLGIEQITRQDVFGRPIPWSNEPGTKSKPKYTYPEYIGSKGPIFLGGGVRDIYESLREKGLSAGDATSLIRALGNNPEILGRGAAVGATEFVGGGLYRETPKH
jgi:flavin-binding protein dodecin